MPGNLSRMIFHLFDLPLPVFRGWKGPIDAEEVIAAAASEAIAHTYTTCFSERYQHVVYGVHMDLLSLGFLDRAPVCMGGEGFFANMVFGSCFSLESSGWLHRCGLVAGQGGYVRMHPSRSLGAVPTSMDS